MFATSIMTGPAPMFNHSCLDNAHHSFAGFGGVGGSGADAGGLMQVRATRALAAGEEVLISYVPDLHEPTAVRRARTRKHKFFESPAGKQTPSGKEQWEKQLGSIAWPEAVDETVKTPSH